MAQFRASLVSTHLYQYLKVGLICKHFTQIETYGLYSKACNPPLIFRMIQSKCHITTYFVAVQVTPTYLKYIVIKRFDSYYFKCTVYYHPALSYSYFLNFHKKNTKCIFLPNHNFKNLRKYGFYFRQKHTRWRIPSAVVKWRIAVAC